jgi:hypothetical protein
MNLWLCIDRTARRSFVLFPLHLAFHEIMMKLNPSQRKKEKEKEKEKKNTNTQKRRYHVHVHKDIRNFFFDRGFQK